MRKVARLSVGVVVACVMLATVLIVAQQQLADDQLPPGSVAGGDPIPPASHEFSDVPTGSPFHSFVSWLVARGITGGCGVGLFCPDAPVTRAQMAVFMKQNSLTGSPLAFGNVETTGSLLSGSGNVASAWDAGNSRYVVTIANHAYHYTQYTTVVTLNSSGCPGYTTGVNSLGGNMIVFVYNASNALAQCRFNFATFYNGN